MKTLADIRKLEDQLIAYQGEDRIVSSHELLIQVEKEVPMGQQTGLSSLDRILNGVEPGEMVIVSGPTGEGKTTLLMTITKNMADKGIPSVWFTLEVTPQAFIRKIYRASGEQMPLFYMPNRNTDNQIDWLEKRIIEAKVKQDVKAVFIDHIHQIFSLHKVKDSISLEIGDMVARIKQMAIDHHLVIFLIAHTRDNSEKPTAEPRKEEIRDSGLISRLADSIVMVWRIRNQDDLNTTKRPDRLDENDTRAKVRVLKNRREGKLGTFLVDHEGGLLKEIDANFF